MSAMRINCSTLVSAAFALLLVLVLSTVTTAGTVANPNTTVPGCQDNTAFFNPTLPPTINVPAGFKVSVFASGLNMPTGIAFLGNSHNFQVFVLESGHGLPSACNEQGSFGPLDEHNPFTPDILIFDKNGNQIGGPLGKPNQVGTPSFQAAGPAVDLAFENGLRGGRLFATDSNQATHAAGQNNSSRIVTVDIKTGKVTPFITELPTGDHPSEQLAFKDGWIYWSQGSTTNSGVVGLDNGGGQNQPDIPCQDITLSQNVFKSSLAPLVETSGYTTFNNTRPGAIVKAFEGAMHNGVCDGAILRAKLNSSHPENTIQPFSWGYRNGYAIRFAPDDHPLSGGLLVGEDGADERGARPSNNAPDALHLASQNADGTPDYHGWPDRFGFLPSSQAVFNPIGGPADDLCSSSPLGFPACIATVLANDVPIADVLAFPPQPITSPLALEAADSSFTGIDFAPKSFIRDPVQRGAALYTLEGDFGFSPPNATAPAPEVGHEVKLINFGGQSGNNQQGNQNSQGNQNDQGNQQGGKSVALQIQGFARNNSGDQAFITPDINAFNRPTNIRFGPDGCAYVVDYGAVRDLGADTHFVGPAVNGPLVQIPGTGVIFKICRQ